MEIHSEVPKRKTYKNVFDQLKPSRLYAGHRYDAKSEVSYENDDKQDSDEALDNNADNVNKQEHTDLWEYYISHQRDWG
jgi:hypothetical protein